MMTWGFPCTDISCAGYQKGFLDDEGNKTRSGMYYEGIRILRKKKPALSIIENVKNLTGKKFKKEFEMVLSDLDEAGYNSYHKVLNAKDFGIPQNRERVFIISIRKDLDNGKFKFPKPFDNGIRLKDVLEYEVDEKYYLSDDKVQRFITSLNSNSSLLYDPCQSKREGKSREYNDYNPTLTSRDYKDPRLVNDNVIKQVGSVSLDNGGWNNPQAGRIDSPSGISPTLNTCGGGQREPKIICGIDKSINGTRFIDKANCLTAREDRGVSNYKQEGTAVVEIGRTDEHQKGGIYSPEGISPTLLATMYKQPVQIGVVKVGNINPSGNGMKGNVFLDDGLAPTMTTNKGEGNKILQRPRGFNKGGLHDVCPTISSHSWECNNFVNENNIRIRKLIPLETFRLMGFTDEEFFRAMIGLSEKADDFVKQHPYLIGKTILDESETIQGISNSQLYKMSGNSIVVDVLYYIYVEIYKAMPYLFDDLRLSSFFSGIGAFESGLDRLFERINTGNFIQPQAE